MSQSIRVHGGHLGFPIELKRNNTSSGPEKGTFVASLVIVQAVVFEKKPKMSRPIRVHGDHLGFLIATKSNNTSSGPIEEHLWQVW